MAVRAMSIPHTNENIDFLFKNNNNNDNVQCPLRNGLHFASSFGAALDGHSSGQSWMATFRP